MAYFDNNSYYKEDLPRLDQSPFTVTSDETTDYNCVAWALGRSDVWISPAEDYEWPTDIERGTTIDIYKELFKKYGYEICKNDSLEDGFQKVAIYFDLFNQFHHVARQLSSEIWTSKLGSNEDIEHELRGLEGNYYGTNKVFMKKALQSNKK